MLLVVIVLDDLLSPEGKYASESQHLPGGLMCVPDTRFPSGSASSAVRRGDLFCVFRSLGFRRIRREDEATAPQVGATAVPPVTVRLLGRTVSFARSFPVVGAPLRSSGGLLP